MHDIGHGNLDGLVDLLLGGLLVVLDEGAVVEALEALERTNVDEHIDVADKNTHALAVLILGAFGLSLEVAERGGLVRGAITFC